MTHSKEVRAEQNKLTADVRSDNCKYREAGRKRTAILEQDFDTNRLPKEPRNPALWYIKILVSYSSTGSQNANKP